MKLRVIRVAQLLLVISAGALWAASRMSWVSLRSFDELGPPRTTVLNGAAWSTALVPLAMLLIAAALAALAVRGWLLRVVSVLVAMACLALGYLGMSTLVMPDVAPRGAALAGVPVVTLVGSERHPAGAVITMVAAVLSLLAAVFLMRAAASGGSTAKYAGPRPTDEPSDSTETSERVMWDALDQGRDPTEGR